MKLNRSPISRCGVAPALLCLAGTACAALPQAEVAQLQANGAAFSEARIIELLAQARPGKLDALDLQHAQGRLIYAAEGVDAAGDEWALEGDVKRGEVLDEARQD